jgi:alpha-glucosidase
MTDPAIAYLPNENYGAYERGVAEDIWLKSANGSATLSLVWPGKMICYLLKDLC